MPGMGWRVSRNGEAHTPATRTLYRKGVLLFVLFCDGPDPQMLTGHVSLDMVCSIDFLLLKTNLFLDWRSAY
jgi:hypothetical protein